MVRQAGFFDLDERYAALAKSCDSLAAALEARRTRYRKSRPYPHPIRIRLPGCHTVPNARRTPRHGGAMKRGAACPGEPSALQPPAPATSQAESRCPHKDQGKVCPAPLTPPGGCQGE